MQHYLDGDLDIDNNLTERVLWIVAIGRKNWLFTGSDAGAERVAIGHLSLLRYWAIVEERAEQLTKLPQRTQE